MFLHLGKDVVIPIQNIIAIIDIDSAKKARDSRAFFKLAEEEGFIRKICHEKVKSLVVTEETKIEKKTGKKIVQSVIYYSPISSTTLEKRSNFINHIKNLEHPDHSYE